ncbi:MAG: YbaB/EbfC family nucleoid-associated protein [Marmoricola sp.]
MTDNPFGAPSSEARGFDLQAMLEQAQQMQAQLVAAQEELAAATVEGTAGGVAVSLTGTGELTAVNITPDSFDGTDADSLSDLGDLVVAAYRDAKSKVDALASQALGPLAGGGLDLGGSGPELPGGFGV